LVWLVDSDDDGWFVDEEDWLVEEAADGWFIEAELDGLAEAEDDGSSAVDDGWFAEAEDDGWLAEAEAPIEPLVEACALSPGMSAFAACALSMAACVRGPLMPSTGPGSKPLSFSACCSWRTDSSPCDALAEADAPFAALEPLLALEDIPEDWLAEAEAAGWLLDDEGWFAEADVDGWLAEADLSLSELVWPAAIAVPAAIRAAASASFLNSMVCVLSYGQLTAVRFGANKASKLQWTRAPSGAGHLRAHIGGTAT
jgi:hypothetical protein